MGYLAKSLAFFSAALVALAGCQGRYGHDGLALFPEGSAPRAFFAREKCSYNSHKDVPTWFCDLNVLGFHQFGLIESKQPLSRDEAVKAFLAYDEGRSGASKGEIEADLKGELAGMQLATLGLEQTFNGAVLVQVVFVGTQTMPDGSGITAWCSIGKDTVYMPQGVQHCHTGMKLLRDRMVELHRK